MKNSYNLTPSSITIIFDGTTTMVPKGALNYEALRTAVLKDDWTEIQKYTTQGKTLQSYLDEDFEVKGSTILYRGEPLPSDLQSRVYALVDKGESPTPVLRFWERVQKNPSYRSVTQLWSFMQHAGIPLTADGCFLAYKGVRNDFYDVHSGTNDNRPGQVLKMPRNKISDDPNTPCHEGLHVGALSYAQGFGPQVVVCKVDPADVVCVPYDSNTRKMRVCRYEVVGFHGAQMDDVLEEEPVKKVEAVKAPLGELVRPLDKGAKKQAAMDEVGAAIKKVNDSFETPDLDSLDEVGLLQRTIQELRQYATHGVKILGANKILGGKPALVTKIMETRRALKGT